MGCGASWSVAPAVEAEIYAGMEVYAPMEQHRGGDCKWMGATVSYIIGDVVTIEYTDHSFSSIIRPDEMRWHKNLKTNDMNQWHDGNGDMKNNDLPKGTLPVVWGKELQRQLDILAEENRGIGARAAKAEAGAEAEKVRRQAEEEVMTAYLRIYPRVYAKYTGYREQSVQREEEVDGYRSQVYDEGGPWYSARVLSTSPECAYEQCNSATPVCLRYDDGQLPIAGLLPAHDYAKHYCCESGDVVKDVAGPGKSAPSARLDELRFPPPNKAVPDDYKDAELPAGATTMPPSE